MSSTDTAYVDPGFCPTDALALDMGPPRRLSDEDTFASDHYEILRLGPQADEDAIERVYRTLADRFHPDNATTGDPRTYLRVKEAYETLSDPSKRAQYNSSRQRSAGTARFRLRGREFFDGVRGEQNRRLAALCLLYRQRISTLESPGLTLLDLETLTGCTREELGSPLWYLRQKKFPVSRMCPNRPFANPVS